MDMPINGCVFSPALTPSPNREQGNLLGNLGEAKEMGEGIIHEWFLLSLLPTATLGEVESLRKRGREAHFLIPGGDEHVFSLPDGTNRVRGVAFRAVMIREEKRLEGSPQIFKIKASPIAAQSS